MLEEEGVNIPYNVVLTKVRRPGLFNLSKNAERSLRSLGFDSQNAERTLWSLGSDSQNEERSLRV